MARDEQLELWLGRIGDAGRGASPRPLVSELIRRARRGGRHPRAPAEGPARTGRGRSGRFNARGRGATAGAVAARSSPWSIDPGSGLRVRARRVVVKARVVRLTGTQAARKAAAHLRYLQRDGVTREGEPGRFYATFSDEADGRAFLERSAGDRHQFRFIVSPEDGGSLETLRGFTRELMARMEADLGTTLDWVAVDHFDTGHPHVHVLLRGVTEEGKVLNIAGDYIAHGIRHRASEIMTRWLGPQTELEVREQLAREVGAERLTQLDRSLLGRAVERRVELGLARDGWDRDGSYQQLLISRARQLERMGLATREAPLAWRLSPDLESLLADLGRRGDIIRTLHLAMNAARLQRRPELYAIADPLGDAAPLVGRVVAAGAAGDFHQRRYLVLDGVDGRSHYCEIGRSEEPAPIGSLVRLEPVSPGLRKADRVIAAVAAASGGRYAVDLHLARDPSATEGFARAHVRRLEALRRLSGAAERLADGSWVIPADFLERALEAERRKARSAPWRIAILSRLDLDSLAVSDGPTWLDGQLLADGEAVARHGYGTEVRRALALRQQWLVAEGLAEARDGALHMPADLEPRLRARELGRAADRLARELGLPLERPRPGDRVDGLLLRRIDLGSGSYALVEGERSFALLPWRPVLQRRIGLDVSGRVGAGGAVTWAFGRSRAGPEIGA